MRIIEEMARIIAEAFGLVERGRIEEAEQSLEETLFSLTGIMPAHIIHSDPHQFAAWLSEDRKFSPEWLEALADLCIARADLAAESDDETERAWWGVAQALLERANALETHTLSLPRMQKLKLIASNLEAHV